jgi:hypothetical protein
MAFVSRRGHKVAMRWAHRQGPRASLTVAFVDSGKTTLVAEDSPIVAGFTPDEDGLFALEDGKEGQRLVVLSLDGGPSRTLAVLPPELSLYFLAMFPDGKGFVSNVTKRLSDAWLAEDFDPDVR